MTDTTDTDTGAAGIDDLVPLAVPDDATALVLHGTGHPMAEVDEAGHITVPDPAALDAFIADPQANTVERGLAIALRRLARLDQNTGRVHDAAHRVLEAWDGVRGTGVFPGDLVVAMGRLRDAVTVQEMQS